MDPSGIVSVLAGFAWLLVVGGVVFLGVTIARQGHIGRVVPLLVGAIVLAVALTSTAAGLVFIQPEERGVVITALHQEGDRQGIRAQALQPGLNWIVPFLETVVRYPVSRQTYTMSSTQGEGQVAGDDSIPARTKDGQQVTIEASIIYAVDPAHVIDLHITWQDRYQDSVIRPVARSSIRDAVAQYGIEEIVSTKRSELESKITDDITQKLAAQNLILSDFLLRNITFSDEYAKAVEQKQIAEQQAQQAAFVVQQRKQEAEQARQVAQGQADAAVIAAKGAADARLIQAEAEAKALSEIAASLKGNPDLIQYNYVQKLGPNVQVMLVPSNSPYLFNLPQVPTAPASTAGGSGGTSPTPTDQSPTTGGLDQTPTPTPTP
jgi:regulator of protease activity HflC (stomatin/prohibitin superfamily)